MSFSGQWLGSWAGESTGDWFGADQAPPPAETARFSSSYWNPNWATDYGPEKPAFKVKVRGKKRRTIRAPQAVARFVATAPVEAVEIAGVDVLADFRAIIARAKKDTDYRTAMAAAIAEIQAEVVRAALERDDEEAILLLLN